MSDTHDILESDQAGTGLALDLQPVMRHWKGIAAATVVAAAAGIGISFAVPNEYTARCVFLPPQQQAGGTFSGLQSANALSSLVGGGVKTAGDQYISLMLTATVSDRIIEKFGLRKVFDVKYEADARKKLLKNLQIVLGKKDNLISVDYTDESRERAAEIANQYVVELRGMTNTLAVSEAQQRRVFFEKLLQETKGKLTSAQRALEGSGINAAAVNTEPRAAADTYAKLQAQLTSAEIRLQVLRTTLADTAPEVMQASEAVSALRSQLGRIESHDKAGPGSGDYVDRYREFKYEETLFDLFARQYEAARVDESREGALIQVVDPATPPERKSAPGRMLYGAVGALLGLAAAVALAYRRSRRAAALPAPVAP